MKQEIGRYTVYFTAALFALMVLAWVVMGNHLALSKVFLPGEEQVRRETFEQSKAFVQGNVQELENMQVEYLKSDKAQRQAVASIILHRVAGVDENLLPPDLRTFIHSLRTERTSYR